MFGADQESNDQDLGRPDVPVTCHGNAVLWGGRDVGGGVGEWKVG